MLLRFDDGKPFAQGSVGYNTMPTLELSDQIIVAIELGDTPIMREAAIDTTSPYLIIPRQTAINAGIDLHKPLTETRARIQGNLVAGDVYTVSMKFLADEGKSVEQPVLAFIPSSNDFDPDPLPPILIGVQGCLDRFLFAYDPFSRTVFFG